MNAITMASRRICEAGSSCQRKPRSCLPGRPRGNVMQISLSFRRTGRIASKRSSDESEEATWPGMFAQMLTCTDVPSSARRSLLHSIRRAFRRRGLSAAAGGTSWNGTGRASRRAAGCAGPLESQSSGTMRQSTLGNQAMPPGKLMRMLSHCSRRDAAAVTSSTECLNAGVPQGSVGLLIWSSAIAQIRFEPPA